MFDFITYFPPTVYRILLKLFLFVFRSRNPVLFLSGSEAGGTASCGVVVGGTHTVFLRGLPGGNVLFLFSLVRNHIR